jgi:Zn-dependent protease
MKWFVSGAGVTVVNMAYTMRIAGNQSVITPLVGILFFMMVINFMLAIFNLIPVPPLDGHWIVAGLLPPGAAESFRRLGRYGIFVLYGLMFLGIFRVLMIPVNWLRYLLIVA